MALGSHTISLLRSLMEDLQLEALSVGVSSGTVISQILDSTP